MVLLGCSSLEDANEGNGNDDEAEAEDGRQACLLFSVDPEESQE